MCQLCLLFMSRFEKKEFLHHKIIVKNCEIGSVHNDFINHIIFGRYKFHFWSLQNDTPNSVFLCNFSNCFKMSVIA